MKLAGLVKFYESEIDPNNPWVDDRLGGREKVAKFLTQVLLRSVSDSGFVLNLDAEWGMGKTYFLQRWRATLYESHDSLYFNAWESDFYQDAFTSFVAEITRQIELSSTDTSAKEKLELFKKKAGRVSKSLVPIVFKAGLRKALGDSGIEDLNDLVSEETENEVIELLGKLMQAEVSEYHRQSEAINEFKNALSNLVKRSDDGKNTPLIIFIDELDRCRPTYAIGFLEAIKHLFSVKGVVFVVATDTGQLCEAIKAVYGQGFDSERYLRRFFDLRFDLPKPDQEAFPKFLWERLEGQVNLPEIVVRHEMWTPSDALAAFSRAFNSTPRDLQQIIVLLSGALAGVPEGTKIFLHWMIFLVFLRFHEKEKFQQFLDSGNLSYSELGFDDNWLGRFRPHVKLIGDLLGRKTQRQFGDWSAGFDPWGIEKYRSVEERLDFVLKAQYSDAAMRYFADFENHIKIVALAGHLWVGGEENSNE